MSDIGRGGDGADLGSAAAGGPGRDEAGSSPAPVRVLLSGEPFAGAAARIAAELSGEIVASRLTDGDPSVWGPAAAGRTGWTGLARASRPLTGQIAALRERFAVSGAHRVLLVGTPDAVAAARLVAASSDGPGGTTRLTALDSADPVQVAEALSGELDETVLVVADPTGRDPVVGAVRHVVGSALADEVGPDTLAARTVHLTEPGSPLDTPDPDGTVVVTLDADVPGRFGALGPLGLVPAGLAGADVGGLLADAVAAETTVAADDEDNPALALAGALAAARGSVLALRDEDRSPAVTAWLAPLLTAAGLVAVPAAPDEHVPGVAAPPPPGSGHDHRPGPEPRQDRHQPEPEPRSPGDTGASAAPLGDDDPGTAPPDVVEVHADGIGAPPEPGRGAIRTDAGPGATIVLWQAATALAARVLGTDVFAPAPPTPVTNPAGTGGPDRPAGPPSPSPYDEPSFVDGGVAVHAGDWLPSDVDTVAGAIDALAGAVRDDGGHLAVSAWLDPESDASVAVLRGPLTRRLGLPVAFGWAPGCRSGDTGAPDRAAHCHLTGGGLDPFGDGTPGGPDLFGDGPGGPDPTIDPATGTTHDPSGAGTAPEPAGLDSLHAAQALAVVADQRRRGRPVLRLHLTDRLTGLVTLARAVQD
ncbi:hypothetical protein WIS52_23880 [Pseudonocardia nematodicida]|uniref:Glucose-6-phosphate isomerase n=1 Tax=Pseudonocardia nematodicida TaxID=1206997 RepID=A0ABV1KGE5_9PSEU